VKLTIDSTEALEDTLRVVGALSNVTLEVSAGAGDGSRSAQAPTSTSSSSRPARASGARARRRPGRKARNAQTRATTKASGQLSTAAVRSWARENGYTVADRGRVPAEVVAAYRNAQPA
jgi:hypothetical protein